MSTDYLTALVARTLGVGSLIRPRALSCFEPLLTVPSLSTADHFESDGPMTPAPRAATAGAHDDISALQQGPPQPTPASRSAAQRDVGSVPMTRGDNVVRPNTATPQAARGVAVVAAPLGSEAAPAAVNGTPSVVESNPPPVDPDPQAVKSKLATAVAPQSSPVKAAAYRHGDSSAAETAARSRPTESTSVTRHVVIDAVARSHESPSPSSVHHLGDVPPSSAASDVESRAIRPPVVRTVESRHTPRLQSPTSSSEQFLSPSIAKATSLIATPEMPSPRAKERGTRARPEVGQPRQEPAVQVTIGRLEVRAVPPTPAQRTRRHAPAVMGLDDYLRRGTHGGGR